MWKAAASATPAGPHGRTAASHWALGGSAARPESATQPRSLESPPQQAKVMSCGTATDGAIHMQVDWCAAQQPAHLRLGLVRGEVTLQEARARHLHAPWTHTVPTQRL